MAIEEIKQLENFLSKIDKVSVYGYEVYVNQVASYVEGIFGEEEGRRFRKLDRTFIYHAESLASMKGYLSALIAIQKNLLTSSTPQIKNEQLTLMKNTSFNNGSPFVFIVHGHDNEIKETVARFVEGLGLKALILHEQRNQGKTIIEKFEEFAEKISYAVVLLTPDDFGTSKSDLKNPKQRARQNVIYELGFFNAKLGRSRVCALLKGDIELPSDYLGVLYIPLDNEGAWKIKVAKEMRAIGLPINVDNIL